MNSNINGGKPYPLGVFRRDVAARTAGAVTKQSGGYKIADTSTTAQVGDIYRPETATTSVMVQKEYKVIEVPDANSFVIASKDLPTSGDTFFILAEVTPKFSSAGVPEVTVDTTGLATEAKQDTQITAANLTNTDLGGVTETAPATDTASSGLNGRLQRIAQRLTSLIALLPSSIGQKVAAGSVSVVLSSDVNTVTANAGTNLNTSALALEATQVAQAALIGAVTEAVPANDTASSGLNGRLQRIAQRVTSLIALLPAALGQGTMSQGLKVVFGTDQTPFADLTASGNITTQNLVPAGAATAGSAVASGAMSGQANALVQVTGTYTGALSLQGTVDGTNWITVGGIPFFNINAATQSATIASATVGIFQIEVSAFTQFRITGLAAMTGTAVVTIRSSSGVGLVGLDSALPTGANVIGALTANQSVNIAQINGVTTLMGNGVTGTGSQRVTIASDNTAFAVNATLQAGTNKIGTVAQAGKTSVNKSRNDYSSVSVTTAAYTQLIASTSAAVSEVEIFDSSGQTLVLATGAALSEVDQIYILPGGNGRVPLTIASGTRVSIKAVSANATVGESTINFYSV